MGIPGAAIVGTGPFKFKSWQSTSDMQLVKNPDYFRKDKNGNKLPYVDRLSFFVISGTATIDALIAGRFHMQQPSMGLQSNDYQVRCRQQAPTLQYFKRINPAPYEVYFDVRSGPLADARVRRAIRSPCTARAAAAGRSRRRCSPRTS